MDEREDEHAQDQTAAPATPPAQPRGQVGARGSETDPVTEGGVRPLRAEVGLTTAGAAQQDPTGAAEQAAEQDPTGAAEQAAEQEETHLRAVQTLADERLAALEEARNTAREQSEARDRAEKLPAERSTELDQIKELAEERDAELDQIKRRAEELSGRAQKAEDELETLREIQATARQARDATKAGVSRKFALYDQWQSSSKRAEARGLLWSAETIAVVLVLAAAGLVTITIVEHLGALAPAVGATALFIAGLVVGIWGARTYTSRLAAYLRDRELAPAEVVDDRGKADGDLDELLRLNRTQMQAYQTLSRGQQRRSSFRSSLIALFAGLSVLIGGIVLVIEVNGDTSRSPLRPWLA